MEFRKGFEKAILSGGVILSVLIIVCWSIYRSYILVDAHSVSTVEAVQDLFCSERIDRGNISDGGNLVVLRVDDVQSFMWSGVSKMLIDGALDSGATVVAGVIPKGITEDAKMASFLRRERCNMEIALHGWDHGRDNYTPGETDGPPEFAELSSEQAKLLIVSGRSVLEELSEEKVTTFIPPNNAASRGTEIALQEEGFEVISSGDSGTFDYSIPTYDFIKKEIVPVEDILTACDRRFSSGKFCVIMFHPQEYSKENRDLDEEIFKNHFLVLLQELKKQNVKFVTFKDLAASGIRDDRVKVE